MRGAAAITRSLTGIGAVLAVLSWAAGYPTADIHVACAASDFDQALVAAIGLTGWACASWFAAVVVAVALAAAPGAVGRWAGGLAGRLAPRFMRAAAHWIVGAALVAGPLASTPALAASPSPGTGPNL